VCALSACQQENRLCGEEADDESKLRATTYRGEDCGEIQREGEPAAAFCRVDSRGMGGLCFRYSCLGLDLLFGASKPGPVEFSQRIGGDAV
jgi:hypothetical protein